jgi:hypothetical protein
MGFYLTLNGKIPFEVQGMSFIALLFVFPDLIAYIATLDLKHGRDICHE